MQLTLTLLIIALMPILLFAKKTKEEKFWAWFKANQADLHSFEKDREAIFDRLSHAMKEVHEELTFEFSPIRENGKREFVISAGGIKEAFPAVESLSAAAPELEKWLFLKYRQRRYPINDLEFDGKEVKAKEVHYAIFKDEDPAKVGIMLFFDGYTEKERESVWGQIGFLFLDEAIGEYDVEMHVGAIVFFGRGSKYFEHARPLAELPDHFDEKLGRK